MYLCYDMIMISRSLDVFYIESRSSNQKLVSVSYLTVDHKLR